jgi:hypothetical protein
MGKGFESVGARMGPGTDFGLCGEDGATAGVGVVGADNEVVDEAGKDGGVDIVVVLLLLRSS